MDHQPYQLDGEHETATGWLYTFTLSQGGAGEQHHELTLSWVDHEHLVGGAIAPERVALAAFGLAYKTLGPDLPARCDVSVLRRRIERFEDRVRERIEAPL